MRADTRAAEPPLPDAWEPRWLPQLAVSHTGGGCTACGQGGPLLARYGTIKWPHLVVPPGPAGPVPQRRLRTHYGVQCPRCFEHRGYWLGGLGPWPSFTELPALYVAGRLPQDQ